MIEKCHSCSLPHPNHPLPIPPSMGLVLVVPSTIEVCQLAEARAPVTEVVVVLVSAGGRRVKGAEGAGGGAAALIVKNQQAVVGGRRRVVISCLQTLGRGRGVRIDEG